MRFFASVSAVLAMASAVVAQKADFNPIYTPKKDETIAAGSTFEITWEAPAKYANEKVTISLIAGNDPTTLTPLSDIATGILNSVNSYQWAVDASLGDAKTYGIVMKAESDPENIFQYSNPFHIAKSSSGASTSSGSGKPTQTVTTAAGIKTVTLTSCPPETTSTTPVISSTFAPNTTAIWTTSKAWNTTTKVNTPTFISTPLPPVTEVPEVPSTTPSPSPVPTPSEVPTAGAAQLVSGPAALIGGLAIAFFAL